MIYIIFMKFRVARFTLERNVIRNLCERCVKHFLHHTVNDEIQFVSANLFYQSNSGMEHALYSYNQIKIAERK